MPLSPDLVVIPEVEESPDSARTPGAALLVDFFTISVDFGGNVGELVRPEAAQLFSEVALALEGDSFE